MGSTRTQSRTLENKEKINIFSNTMGEKIKNTFSENLDTQNPYISTFLCPFLVWFSNIILFFTEKKQRLSDRYKAQASSNPQIFRL